MASLFRIPPSMDESARTRCDALIKLVENACSDILTSPDWTLNMQIVDGLNREQDPVVLSEVIRIVRKKLGSGNPRVLSVTLTLAETLVKNCGFPVHEQVATERFMVAMAKVARTHAFKTGRDNMAIADQALDIIQAWGEAFLPQRRDLPLFVETYHELRAESLPFSAQYQADRPPVLAPGAGSLLDRPDAAVGTSTTSVQPSAKASSERGSSSSAPTVSRSPSQGMEALSVSDKEIVATASSCAEMLDQVLRAADSRAEVRDSEITAEVVNQLKQASPKLLHIIEANGEADAGFLDTLFKIHDSVDTVLRLHSDVVDGKVKVPMLPPSSLSARGSTTSNKSDASSTITGLGKLSISNVASARKAASKARNSIPAIRGPPMDQKQEQMQPSSRSAPASDTFDLLSGFELPGSSLGTGSSASGAQVSSTSDDMLAVFATPSNTQTGPSQQEQQQRNQGMMAAPSGAQSQQASSSEKARNLMNNLGALYAGGGGAMGMGYKNASTNNSIGTNQQPSMGWNAGGEGTTGHGFGGTGMQTMYPQDNVVSMGTTQQQPPQTGGLVMDAGTNPVYQGSGGAEGGDPVSLMSWQAGQGEGRGTRSDLAERASPLDDVNPLGQAGQQQRTGKQQYLDGGADFGESNQQGKANQDWATIGHAGQGTQTEEQGNGIGRLGVAAHQDTSGGGHALNQQQMYNVQSYGMSRDRQQQMPQNHMAQQTQLQTHGDGQQGPYSQQEGQMQNYQQQPQDYQLRPQQHQQQPQQSQQGPQNYQQQPQDFQQQPQDYQQQSQQYQQQPQDYQQQPQQYQQRLQDYQQQPQDYQQQPQDYQQQPQDYQQQPQDYQQQPQDYQQQPQQYQQRPQDYQQQPQDYQQQPQDYQQQPQDYQQQPPQQQYV